MILQKIELETNQNCSLSTKIYSKLNKQIELQVYYLVLNMMWDVLPQSTTFTELE